MEEYFPLPERRYPSPSAQRRSGEHWKARFGLAAVVILTLLSAGLMFRLAGVGVGIAVSPLRGQSAAPRPTAAATAPSAAGQPAGEQPAAPANPTGQQAAAQAPPAAQPTTAATVVATAAAAAAAAPTTAAQPSPTTRPGQKEYVVQQGDTLFAIAQRNGTSVDALVAANNLRSRDATLSIGQKLIIP
jgi:LysM repeat protein